MAQINIQEILTFRKQTLLAAVNSSCKKGPKNVLDLGGRAGAMLGIRQRKKTAFFLFMILLLPKKAEDSYLKNGGY